MIGLWIVSFLSGSRCLQACEGSPLDAMLFGKALDQSNFTARSEAKTESMQKSPLELLSANERKRPPSLLAIFCF